MTLAGLPASLKVATAQDKWATTPNNTGFIPACWGCGGERGTILGNASGERQHQGWAGRTLGAGTQTGLTGGLGAGFLAGGVAMGGAVPADVAAAGACASGGHLGGGDAQRRRSFCVHLPSLLWAVVLTPVPPCLPLFSCHTALSWAHRWASAWEQGGCMQVGRQWWHRAWAPRGAVPARWAGRQAPWKSRAFTEIQAVVCSFPGDCGSLQDAAQALLPFLRQAAARAVGTFRGSGSGTLLLSRHRWLFGSTFRALAGVLDQWLAPADLSPAQPGLETWQSLGGGRSGPG